MAMPAAATTHDQTFGTGGIVRIPLAGVGSPTAAEAIAVQNDGKLVVAGRAQGTSGSDFAVTRLNLDGSLDTTFGPAHTGTATAPFGGTFNEAFGVAVDAGGNIVAVGQTNVSSTSGPDIAIARWDAQGNPDAAAVRRTRGDSAPADHVGTAGVTAVGFALIANGYDGPIAIARQSDGKLVLAGGAATDNSGGDQWALARLKVDGTLDNSGPGAFSGDGKLTFVMGPAGSGEEAKAVKVQQDGKIVAAGGA